MSIFISLSKWILIIIGAISVYYGAMLQFKYGVTSKVIGEMITPKLHPEAMEKVYMPMTNILLDTSDITMASIVRVKVADDVSNEDVEEAMTSIATAEGIRDVGKLPLSEMVKLQTGEEQRFLKVFQYCSPRTAMIMVDYSDAFSAYLPCRITQYQKTIELLLFITALASLAQIFFPIPISVFSQNTGFAIMFLVAILGFFAIFKSK
ncbi:MAG: DUF302 domain-containing protein [Candidatus Thioglobus sp.]|nr:DUF302 domain-containing protein [Candidatus Thioglobus sp.]